MELICFDLDGTLLNDASEISLFTKNTLALLRKKDIAYTVATGRTMLSGQSILHGHDFDLPQIYNNGVTTWDPKIEKMTLENLLSEEEISIIIDVALAQGVAPFVNAISSCQNQQHHHFIYHAQTHHEVEKDLVTKYFSRTKAKLLPLQSLPHESTVTNISMIGAAESIHTMWLELNLNPNLIAYSGTALQGNQFRWMDVHHCQANKGSAVTKLKQQLGATKLICFGDSDNDLSMFSLADESYAPENAKADIKEAASAIIGHNHDDGIARFLRERFSL